MQSNRVFGVWELNKYIKRLLEDNRHLTHVWVKGEIVNLKIHTSGHVYFSLYDEESSIRCVMFKTNAQNLEYTPQNGHQVLVVGSVSVYVREGVYQLYVIDMEPIGTGPISNSLEELKQKLAAEGLFSIDRKRLLVDIPQKIGIVTSLSGAALQDILSILSRRYPLAQLYIAPAFVQGDQAVPTLCTGIDLLNNIPDLDVIILARGGGSSEDLSPFNDEGLARTIYYSRIPIVSAVGHETDFTISDLVADVRAPTPSAAAEQVCPNIQQLKKQILNLRDRLANHYNRQINICRERVNYLAGNHIRVKPINRIREEQQRVDFLSFRLTSSITKQLKQSKSIVDYYEQSLYKANPQSILNLGPYCIAINSDNKYMDTVDQFQLGNQFKLKLRDGVVSAQVVWVSKEENNE